MSDRLEITTATQLSPEEIGAILTVVEEATRADGTPPLNEAALLHLRRGYGAIEHLIAKGDGQIVGYAQRQDGAVPTGQLVVSPVHRDQGIGTALLDGLIGRGPVQVLAVGNRLAAQALARSHGMQPRRTLLIMERSLEDPVPESAAPDGVIIRTFRPGADEDDWIAVNARAFADHPEQGRITRRDLDDRLAESWFDPAGFFVAISAGRMVGFHWTKQHDRSTGRGLRARSGPRRRRTRSRQGVVDHRVTAPQTTRKHPRPALRRGGSRGSNCLVLSLWFPCSQP